MKHTLAASALIALAAARPQWAGPSGADRGNWAGQSGPFGGFPSCVDACRDNNADYSDYNNLCDSNDNLNTLNTCVDASSCSDAEKSHVKQAIVQLCANAGATITAAPFASYSATSGKLIQPTGGVGHGGRGGPPGQWGAWARSNGVTGWPTASSEWSSWAVANGLPTASAEWQSWASQHGCAPGGGPGRGPFGPYASNTAAWSSAASEWSAWIASNTIPAWPTAPSQWSSFTSAHPLPTGLSSYAAWCQANGFPGGSVWPTAWTTNPAWAPAVSAWNGNGTGPGPEGWGGPGGNGGYGPFGRGGPGGRGWGNGPWASDGAWTSGPWTSWWGTDGCPASTWSGWTDGPWSTDAPWTTWSGCAATTTGSSVYTTTVTPTDGGSAITSVATSFGVRVAQATQDLQSITVNSDSGAMPTNMAFAGSAAGVIGVVAGALLL
ncbi:hypothetical protein CLAFUW4_10614 [Fulvia fulva]|uniref:Extracellular membrane protein CFEM domain-containing protein n=1 Tax=Passalora fulva TaxID=5499 RepID=A0A9Q8LF05_PASFU|nr:uncharacterized protein CLAFUR5_05227 [Fulvia fulva]KAK4615565.1 hypothetical protein CLAFUR4_10619 [Fulvia fulva]KAK4617336.1 hypothetical protein CLAFUR0_10625 [Fulvia fulva]UJO16341.1 hypothetical protein CLAFUR5_05227 [Fulvia fulva]WPV19429.1 hypothetical protein CLAFUW4_10614 [Fulvia fulva]WPV34534.1 hypothetical protein CLAFUW7_10616 [Fulvia fulva]